MCSGIGQIPVLCVMKEMRRSCSLQFRHHKSQASQIWAINTAQPSALGAWVTPAEPTRLGLGTV